MEDFSVDELVRAMAEEMEWQRKQWLQELREDAFGGELPWTLNG